MGRPNVEDARRSDCGRLPQQSNVDAPTNTRKSHLWFVIYTSPSLVEQTTRATSRVPTLTRACQSSLYRRGLRRLELGGTSAWLEPNDSAPERVRITRCIWHGSRGRRGLRSSGRHGRDEAAVEASETVVTNCTTLVVTIVSSPVERTKPAILCCGYGILRQQHPFPTGTSTLKT